MSIKNNESHKQSIVISLKKARSLLDTIISMVEKDEYCVDIMQQNLSAIGLLKAAHERIMKDHLQSCFAEGVATGGNRKRQELIDELQTLMKLYNK